jgi:hypothetical protein
MRAKVKIGRYYLMRNGEPCGPIEWWNPFIVIAPMTRAADPGGPSHHTFGTYGTSTWQEQFELVDELVPKHGKRKRRVAKQ